MPDETSTLLRNTGTENGTGTDGAVEPKTLTLQQLQQELAGRGIFIGYSSLSEFIKTGDVADQLGAGGGGSRRAFHPDALEVLTHFLPEFRAAGGKVPQAPAMLRSFLKQRNSGDMVHNDGGAQEIALPGDADLPAPRGLAAVLGSLAGLPAALRELGGAIREMRQARAADPPAPPPQDRLLTADDAAGLLACHRRAVGRYVKPVLPGKWRLSDVLEYIAGLGVKESEAGQ